METLKTLLEKHPNWADLPIVVYTSNGYDWIGGAASVYTDKTPTNEEDLNKDVRKIKDWTKVLVFAPN